MASKKVLSPLNKRDRRERFVVLANRRVNKALHDIQLIGNLSDKSNYVYDQKQADKIIEAMTVAIDDMKGRFDRGGEPDTGFTLEDAAL